MTREEIFSFAREKFSVTEEFPWDDSVNAVLRHPQSKKWFAILMDVKKKSLGLSHTAPDETACVMNVKLPPVLIQDLLHEDGFLPAYHMNKKFWISLRIDSLQEATIENLLEKSWDAVKPKVKAKKNT